MALSLQQHGQLVALVSRAQAILSQRYNTPDSSKRLRELGRMARFIADQRNANFDAACIGLDHVVQIFEQNHNAGDSELRWKKEYADLRADVYGSSSDYEDEHEDDEDDDYACDTGREADRPMTTRQTPAGVFAVKDLVSAPLMRGAQVAAADEAGNLVLDMARRFLGDSYPEAFKTAKGEEVAKIVMATMIKTLAHNGILPMDTVNICKVCDMVLEAAARDVVQPMIVELSPALKSLATLAPK